MCNTNKPNCRDTSSVTCVQCEPTCWDIGSVTCVQCEPTCWDISSVTCEQCEPTCSDSLQWWSQHCPSDVLTARRTGGTAQRTPTFSCCIWNWCSPNKYVIIFNYIWHLVIYRSQVTSPLLEEKEGNVLFNDVLNTFNLVIWCQIYGKGPLR